MFDYGTFITLGPADSGDVARADGKNASPAGQSPVRGDIVH